MANIEENPQEVEAQENMAKAADKATGQAGKTPGELIAQHEEQIKKMTDQFEQLKKEAAQHNEAMQKIKTAMLNLDNLMRERMGAIKGLRELVEQTSG